MTHNRNHWSQSENEILMSNISKFGRKKELELTSLDIGITLSSCLQKYYKKQTNQQFISLITKQVSPIN